MQHQGGELPGICETTPKHKANTGRNNESDARSPKCNIAGSPVVGSGAVKVFFDNLLSSRQPEAPAYE
jgi:hypothetical protein